MKVSKGSTSSDTTLSIALILSSLF